MDSSLTLPLAWENKEVMTDELISQSLETSMLLKKLTARRKKDAHI